MTRCARKVRYRDRIAAQLALAVLRAGIEAHERRCTIPSCEACAFLGADGQHQGWADQ